MHAYKSIPVFFKIIETPFFSSTAHSHHHGRLSNQHSLPIRHQYISRLKSTLIDKILDREWYLEDPSTHITPIHLDDTSSQPSFILLRDDLKHPYISGNKRRKLDGLWPEINRLNNVRDVVTCGGVQSAHIVAVAVAAAENRIRAHVLVRGEKPQVVSGNHLFARMLAHKVVYVSRKDYADRIGLLSDYAAGIQDELNGKGQAVIIPEGAAEPAALLGMIRLMHWLMHEQSSHLCGVSRDNAGDKRWTLVIDSGTGTTAIGLALGAALLGLSKVKIIGITLAAPREYYIQQTISLVRSFCAKFNILDDLESILELVGSQLEWKERITKRKFGNMLPGVDMERCKQIAQRFGVIVDPIWSLSAWEMSVELSKRKGENDMNDEDEIIIMLCSGGVLGLNGLAQRYTDEF